MQAVTAAVREEGVCVRAHVAVEAGGRTGPVPVAVPHGAWLCRGRVPLKRWRGGCCCVIVPSGSEGGIFLLNRLRSQLSEGQPCIAGLLAAPGVARCHL